MTFIQLLQDAEWKTLIQPLVFLSASYAVSLILLWGVFSSSPRLRKQRFIPENILHSLLFYFIWGVSILIVARILDLFGGAHPSLYVTGRIVLLWASTRLLALPIKSKLAVSTISAVLCTMMALDLLGLWQDTIDALEAMRLSIGNTEVTAWSLIKGSALVGVFVWLAILALRGLDSKLNGDERIHPSAKILISKILRISVLTFVTIWGLSIAGVDVAMLTVFGGTIAVGAAFGMQNVISNLFCGILLLVDRSIKPGDVVGLQDGKIYGIVKRLNARYVSIWTREGKEHLIPNEYFVTNKVENWSYSNRLIRCSVPLQVTIGSDLTMIECLLIEEMSKIKRVLNDPPPAVRFKSLEENRVNIEVRFWIGDPENGWSGIRSEFIGNVMKAFYAQGVVVPLQMVELKHSQVSEPVDTLVAS